jgi:hypothetical protein
MKIGKNRKSNILSELSRNNPPIMISIAPSHTLRSDFCLVSSSIFYSGIKLIVSGAKVVIFIN